MFNPKCTFKSLVLDFDDSNADSAHAIALAVAKAPGRANNPLVIYGTDGLGKTHLLHAIGQYVSSHKKNTRVAYLSAYKFACEHANAIANRRLTAFRKKYTQKDVLLIDDFQFLVGNESIQEEALRLFNELKKSHKQIVLACDRPLNKINGLETSLISFLEDGAGVELRTDEKMRAAILQNSARSMNVTFSEDVTDFLVKNFRNLRRLNGAAVRIAARAYLDGKMLNLKLVKSELKEMLCVERRSFVPVGLGSV